MVRPIKKFSTPSVTILMCTYNGERYLAEQLDSIALQTHSAWRLIVSDDGSTDGTLQILKAYQDRWGAEKLEIRKGPCRGFVANFLSLACDKKIDADFFAFSDQDDVWLPNKLGVAFGHMQGHDHGIPHLYGSRTTCVDEHLRVVGASPRFAFPCGFRNALIQSFAGGNTMVFNRKAKQLFELAGIKDVPVHDWWAYLLVSGAGGHVHYDPNSYLLYRQHRGSLIGANDSMMARVRRLLSVLGGEFRGWTDRHLVALNESIDLLDGQSRETLGVFTRLRGGTLPQRIRMVEVCGLYRQTWRGTLSLYLAILFHRL